MPRFLSELMDGVMELGTLRLLSEWTQAVSSFAMWIPAIVYAWRGGTPFRAGLILYVSIVLWAVLFAGIIPLILMITTGHKEVFGWFPEMPIIVLVVFFGWIYGVIFAFLVRGIRYFKSHF